LAARIKTARPVLAPTQPRQQEDAPVVSSPVEIMLGNGSICGDGMNLVKSAVSDDEGSYLIMSIEVPVPFTAAYAAWIKFAEVPHFMRGNYQTESGDGSRMTWRIQTLFDQFAWQAKVCEQEFFELIAWKSVQGTSHPGFGSVSFEPLSQRRTWIMVQIAFDMSGAYRWLGDPLPSLSHKLEQSMQRFYNSMTTQSWNEIEALQNCTSEKLASPSSL
jgi:uncharacterized membrane protein